jgi:hypothetical protein
MRCDAISERDGSQRAIRRATRLVGASIVPARATETPNIGSAWLFRRLLTLADSNPVATSSPVVTKIAIFYCIYAPVNMNN